MNLDPDEFKDYLRDSGRQEAFESRVKYFVENLKYSEEDALEAATGEFSVGMDEFKEEGGEEITPSLSAEEFAGAEDANALKVIKWVFNNIGIKDLQPKDAPSAGAWQLLETVRADEKTRREFLRMWAKTVPSGRQLEEARKYDSDEKQCLELIEQIRLASRRSKQRAKEESDPALSLSSQGV